MKLTVSGMSCGGCVSSVNRILVRELDVDESGVDVDLESGTATVPDGADPDKLKVAIARLDDAGFSASVKD